MPHSARSLQIVSLGSSLISSYGEWCNGGPSRMVWIMSSWRSLTVCSDIRSECFITSLPWKNISTFEYLEKSLCVLLQVWSCEVIGIFEMWHLSKVQQNFSVFRPCHAHQDLDMTSSSNSQIAKLVYEENTYILIRNRTAYKIVGNTRLRYSLFHVCNGFVC